MVALLALLAAACGAFPRDPDGTLDRVREDGRFRIGLFAGEGGEGPAAALIDRVARQTGAAPEIVAGEGETLLTGLEEGRLDMVIGQFDKASPWKTRVTIGPPLARSRRGAAEFHLAPAMRNGENAWIALIERQARDLAPEAR